jgi:hydrogenase/urease accessory protein HupE
VWAISRTIGVPLGPQPWRPEAVGVADVLSTLDELAAVVLVAAVLALRARGAWISPAYLRLAAMVAGPLFLYSTLARSEEEATIISPM